VRVGLATNGNLRVFRRQNKFDGGRDKVRVEDQADRTVAVTCCYLPLSTTGHPCSLLTTPPPCTMSTPSAVKQRPSSTRHSRITVEYHRPSRESIQEYGALLDQANLHATSNNSSTFIPSRLPPPPPSGPSSFKPKDPLSPTPTSPTSPAPKVRNSLQKKQPPRNRKPTIQTDTIRANHSADPPTPNNTDLSPAKTSFIHSNGSSPNVVSPPRPSRANTTTLNDIFPTQSVTSQRRISTPVIGSTHDFLASYISAADPAPPVEEEESRSSHPVLNPIMNTPSTPKLPPSFTTNGTGTTRARSATVNKGNKGMLGFVSGLLGSNKRVEISTPYDPVHLTHVGFNTSTGEFTGLPKEWQQLLQESGISRTEQEKNPEAVMEIVKFYQEGGGGGDVWDKMGGALKTGPPILPAPPPSKPLMDESFYTPVRFPTPFVSVLMLTPSSGQHQAHQSGLSNLRWYHRQTCQPLHPLHRHLPAMSLRRKDRASTAPYPHGRSLRPTAPPCLGRTRRRRAEPRPTVISPRTNNRRNNPLTNRSYRHYRRRRNPRSTPVPSLLLTILPRTSKHTTRPSNPVKLERV